MAYLIEKPQEICRDHYLLKIDIGTGISRPGQFANIKIGYTDPLLRRPFSIYDHNGTIIEIIFKVVGKGTGLLKDIDKAGSIDVIAPLGNGFSLPLKKKVLLIGGGVGNAPVHYLAKKLKDKENELHYLYAARSREYVYNKEEYKSIADNFNICTDDGTEGLKGIAGEIISEVFLKDKYDNIYICGPAAMMKSVADTLKNTDARIEVSMENYFGCGIGLCFGCAIETTDGMKRACVDGPVFDGRSILWNSLLQ